MKRSKLHLALAMATAVGGVSGGLLFAPSAGAVNLTANHLGDVLIFPYYTTREGWASLFNITNTSNKTLAVKVRFMEGYNSRDVLDFVVVMSPKDVFAGSISDTGSSPVFQVGSEDTSCTVPAIPAGGFVLNSLPGGGSAVQAYTGTDADDGPTGINRSREGYMLAMVMGTSDSTATTSVAYNAKHVNGVPRNCSAVVSAFAKDTIAATASQFGEPINALKGNYNFLNANRGISAGGAAVTLANFANFNSDLSDPGADSDTVTLGSCSASSTATTMFYNPTRNFEGRNADWAPTGQNTAFCLNLLTAQEGPDFLEPSLTDAYPNIAATANESNPAASTIYQSPFNGADYGFGAWAVSEVLRATNLINEWSFNPDLGATTEWVVTHPTKAFWVDGFNSVQAALSNQRFPTDTGNNTGFDPPTDGASLRGFTPMPPFSEGFSQVRDGQSCNEVGITFYDREEDSFIISGGIVPSPAPRNVVALCFEANVIEFSAQNGTIFGSELNLDLSTDLAGAVAADTLRTPFGWMNLNLAKAASAKWNYTTSRTFIPGPGAPPAAITLPNTLLGDGLPAVGFMIKQRQLNIGLPDLKNYAYLADHAFGGRGIPCSKTTTPTCQLP